MLEAVAKWAEENGASYILLGVDGEDKEAFERYWGTSTELAALLGSAMIDGGDLGEATVSALRAISNNVGNNIRG